LAGAVTTSVGAGFSSTAGGVLLSAGGIGLGLLSAAVSTGVGVDGRADGIGGGPATGASGWEEAVG